MRRTTALVIAFALVLVLAGCGSSSSDSSSGSSGASGGSSTTKATSSSDSGYGSDDYASNDSSSADTEKTTAMAKTAGLTGKVNLPDEADEQIVTASSADVAIELSDFYIGPTYLQAKGGTTLHATITNKGTMPHTFTIDSLKIDEVLQPGDKATVDIAVPATGALKVYCRFHKASGMQGAIVAT